MPRSLKPIFYNPFIYYSYEDENKKRFVFQNSFKESSTPTFSSATNSPQENLDSLITRLNTNPPYQLALSIEELLAPSKRKNKSSRYRPPRPQNAFILFKKDLVARIRRDSPDINLQ